MITALQHCTSWLLQPFRWLLGRGFGYRLNPFQHLGALTIFFCWIVLVSGIWLLIFFRTSVDGAYQSVEYITHHQWYFGSVMRSLHRYASDAAVITLVLHVVREFSIDHQRGKHWFSWISGIPLAWILALLGITGYWLVWDNLAHYVALLSAELLDSLPVFTGSMARNFLTDSSLSDRFFTLMVFLHVIGLPLFFVFAIWLHVFRISAPRINPPRTLMIIMLAVMILLSLLFPAMSQDRIDLSQVPESIGLDWFYLLIYPLIQNWSPTSVWALLLTLSAMLLLAPWLPPAAKKSAATVDLDNCNGCERCANDCPYEAISMMPRSDNSAHELEAVVDPDLCVSCGLCLGACPTAMPFRTRSELIPGIDLPDLSAAAMRNSLHDAAAGLEGDQRIMVIGCAGDRDIRKLRPGHQGILEVVCMGQLPPSYIDYILSRNLADGVMLAGCGQGECRYRLGLAWTEQRIGRQRDPRLRKRVNLDQIALGWQAPWSEYPDIPAKLDAFRQRLKNPDSSAEMSGNESVLDFSNPKKLLAMCVAAGLFIALIARFSNWPDTNLRDSDQAVISLTFTQAGELLQPCRKLTQEELDQLPANMRKTQECGRERQSVGVVFKLDDKIIYEENLPPTGIWNDGEVTVYQRINIPQGHHRLFIGMRTSARQQGYDYRLESDIELGAGQHLVVEYDDISQAFVINQGLPPGPD